MAENPYDYYYYFSGFSTSPASQQAQVKISWHLMSVLNVKPIVSLHFPYLGLRALSA